MMMLMQAELRGVESRGDLVKGQRSSLIEVWD